jgi:hypothetical protein
MSSRWELPGVLTDEVSDALALVQDYWEMQEYMRRIFMDNDPCPDLLAKYGPKSADSAISASPAPV